MQQQQNTGMGQQNIMPQPPSVITTKDHMYISDMLSWNLLAIKKAHSFASQCQDPEITTAIEHAGQMHYAHYQTLLNHLNQQQNQQMQTGMQ